MHLFKYHHLNQSYLNKVRSILSHLKLEHCSTKWCKYLSRHWQQAFLHIPTMDAKVHVFKHCCNTIKTGFIEIKSITDWAMIETECLWNRNISRKKPVLKDGTYLALTKHRSITDRAMLEHLSLNSTSGNEFTCFFYTLFMLTAVTFINITKFKFILLFPPT